MYSLVVRWIVFVSSLSVPWSFDVRWMLICRWLSMEVNLSLVFVEFQMFVWLSLDVRYSLVVHWIVVVSPSSFRCSFDIGWILVVRWLVIGLCLHVH